MENKDGCSLATDRWSLKPGFLSVLTAAILAFACSLPGLFSTIMIPLAVLGCGIATITILLASVYFFIRKRPRDAVSLLLIVLLPVLLRLPIFWLVDVVHLGLNVGFGMDQSQAWSQEDQNGFTVYDWSVGFVGSPVIVLVHDATDEIVLPPAQHTHPLSSEGRVGEFCAGNVRRLIPHYYTCSF